MTSLLPQIIKHLESLGQSHIITEYEKLPESQKSELLTHLSSIDFKQLKHLQHVIHEKVPSLDAKKIERIQVAHSGEQHHIQAGEEAIAQGHALCLMVAGGEGSRLNFSGPKGAFPITRFKQKSLFQLISEKVIAAGLRYGHKLPLVIMTSEKNHDETLSFFQKRHYFGLAPEQIAFIQQLSLPYLDKDGRLILESPTKLALGPNGNGLALQTLYNSPVCQHLLSKDIKYINFIQVDNPLADPYDAALIGYHALEGNCITIKCTEKESPSEKVGMLVNYDKKPFVVEYSELETLPSSCAPENFPYANLSMFCFSTSFVKKISSKLDHKIPIHKAWKKTAYLSAEGKTCAPLTPNAWKFEYFIFDILSFAKKASCLSFPRKHCFSPLKNLSGPCSPNSVQRDLLAYDKEILSSITGLPPPKFSFELSPKFYYPTKHLLSSWKAKAIEEEESYIDP